MAKVDAPPPMDLKSLEHQLRQTNAIGFMTKIALKNQVDDLVTQFKEFHQSGPNKSAAGLRPSYDRLMMKVLALVQDDDVPLAHSLIASREAIWGILADPVQFKSQVLGVTT